MNEPEQGRPDFQKTPQELADELASKLRADRLNAAMEGFVWTLQNCPHRLRVTDLSEVAYKSSVPLKNRRGKPPSATLTIRATPKMIAQIQKSDAEERFRFLIVAIPEESIERMASPIVLPGEIS